MKWSDGIDHSKGRQQERIPAEREEATRANVESLTAEEVLDLTRKIGQPK
jgi:hypothetical protein